MDLTTRKRRKIVTLHEHTSLTQRQIAEQCGVSLGSVNNIIKLKNVTGSIYPKRKGFCGRKRKTTTKDDAILLKNSKLHPEKNSFDLKKDLEDAGVHIHDCTVFWPLTRKPEGQGKNNC
uniref:Paired domain-containing protein n=1 Tax=Clastoptera arizonana TaxID=38151 RepID=A0A1B6C860_9HEMI